MVPDIIKSLEEENITRAFVNYWLAYPITFITGEKIIAAPYHSHDRYPPYAEAVHNSSAFAYIFKYKQLIGRQQQNQLFSNGTAYQKKCYRWGYLLIIGEFNDKIRMRNVE